jgi:peptidoglycan/xylan/chitin deacetylase (PgdA/CDA1 family)
MSPGGWNGSRAGRLASASPSQVPVLMYHSIGSRPTRPFRDFVVEPAEFVDQMEALVDAGYRPATLTDCFSGSADGRDKQVVLTFDDAFEDFHSTVLPILTGLGLPATLYVPTAYVGGTSRWLWAEGEGDRPMMSWEGVAEAAASGVEIGSHSRTHPQLDLHRAGQLGSEVRDSRSELEDRLQCDVLSFAYPFGYYDSAVRAETVRAGYRSACAVRDLTSTRADPFAITRLTVRPGTGAPDLLRLLDRRTGAADELRSKARARASRTLRRLGLVRPVRTPAWGGRGSS